ncbi:MAG: hypothetical protein R2771_07345 [Saprospiraceae bacterium]
MIVIESEVTELQDCSSDYSKIVSRVYKAIDDSGNVSEPCTQTINVLRLNKKELEFPQDFLISDNSALKMQYL